MLTEDVALVPTLALDRGRHALVLRDWLQRLELIIGNLLMLSSCRCLQVMLVLATNHVIAQVDFTSHEIVHFG